MHLTKADIDGLVEGLPPDSNDACEVACVAVTRARLRKELYLAAGRVDGDRGAEAGEAAVLAERVV